MLARRQEPVNNLVSVSHITKVIIVNHSFNMLQKMNIDASLGVKISISSCDVLYMEKMWHEITRVAMVLPNYTSVLVMMAFLFIQIYEVPHQI